VSERPGWDDYFLGIAHSVSARADCTRRRVGAVLVKDNRIVATGYNGAPAGDSGCLEGACPRGQLSYEELQEHSDYERGPGRCISIHAEVNTLLYSSLDDRRGAVLYITDAPCPACMKVIRGSGVARAHWTDGGNSAGWDRSTGEFYSQ
jgi:dCMP deaminase